MNIIYQTKIQFRGITKEISELKKSSRIKINIVCQKCYIDFTRHANILFDSGNFLCQKCFLKDKNSKQLCIGFKKNKLTVISNEYNGKCKVKCDCGKIFITNNYSVKSGHTKSCGCIKSESLKSFHKENNNFQSGENHPNWKGGVTDKNRRLRSTSKYKEWRISIFERDNYTCKKCGKIGGTLNAHHIENLSQNESKITDINNGITLCIKCHNKFHKEYGRVNINKNMLDNYLKK